MSAISPTPSFDPGQVRPWWKDSSGLTAYLHKVSLFLRRFRSRLRVGEHSRSPLRLLRFHLSQGTIACEWVARAPDPWDAFIPAKTGQRHASLQALKDAIDIRALLFQTVSEVDYAQVRAYRRGPGNQLELIVAGDLRRHSGTFWSTRSLVMRAKLLGFHFRMEDGILTALRPEEEI